MKTSRMMTLSQASSLDLPSRIKLEAEITDAQLQRARILRIPPDWTFDQHRNRSPWRRYLFDFLGPVQGKTILDLGCGIYPTPVYFALAGAEHVHACDVSPRAVDLVEQLAEEYGVADRVTARVCPAEQLCYDDEQFDLVHGQAVLHHLQLTLAGPEIARVLKRGGKGAFKDPLGQNPLIEFGRDHFQYRGKSREKATDRPLRFADLRALGHHFSFCAYRGFGLISSIGVVLCRRRGSRLERVLRPVDGILLRACPPLEWFCRYVVTTVQK